MEEKEKQPCNSKIPFSFILLPPDDFILIATFLGLMISRNLSIDEQNALGNFLLTIGQTIVTFAGQKEFLESQEELIKKTEASAQK